MSSDLKVTTTARGFDVVEFADGNGKTCSLQKSSVATDDYVWLGCDEIGLKRFTPGTGWEDVSTEDEPVGGRMWLANTRMHLTRDQVAALLPHLKRFVKTGDLLKR